MKKRTGEIVKRKPDLPPMAGTPAEMIFAAVSNGSNLEQLEKLLALNERHEANQARKAFHKAMAAFKANPPNIIKNKRVQYSTTKGAVDYRHATLDNVVEAISTSLSKQGLSATFQTKQEQSVISVTCKVTHELGHSEVTTLSASPDDSGSKNPIQAIGSTVTYLERYTLLAITGLATKGQDNDGGKPSVAPSTARPEASEAEIVAPNPENECHGCGAVVSDKIRDYSKKQYGKCLCMKCQKAPRS